MKVFDFRQQSEISQRIADLGLELRVGGRFCINVSAAADDISYVGDCVMAQEPIAINRSVNLLSGGGCL
ncbi:hypothetical protein [Halococcoides cellulosivorans]|uniref:Uncharacterized protein n=1 Tax=Halococcoides cellulosivorans TaxID=1679096 RepID=A0A2R4X3L4_9EURY|nr:hypothetical protein [Halococcoides cellulosivorans]AWB28391.1 hypothetical protein HARCEL1_12090 [Halococcoides cellulosivorans]